MFREFADGAYDEQALPAYTNPNRLMRFVFWERVRLISSLLNGQPKVDLALDFGAGLGLMVPILADRAREVVAVEIEPAKLEEGLDKLGISRGRLRIERTLAGAGAGPLGRVALILAMDVLEHVEDLDGTLRDLRRTMTPDGRLLISGPTENVLYRLGRRLAGYSGHYHRRGIRDIERALRRDFQVVKRRVIFPLAPLFVILDARPR